MGLAKNDQTKLKYLHFITLTFNHQVHLTIKQVLSAVPLVSRCGFSRSFTSRHIDKIRTKHIKGAEM